MDDKTILRLASVANFLAWAALAAGSAGWLTAVYGLFLYEGRGAGAGFYDILLFLLSAAAVAAVFFALRFISRTLKSMTGPGAGA